MDFHEIGVSWNFGTLLFPNLNFVMTYAAMLSSIGNLAFDLSIPNAPIL